MHPVLQYERFRSADQMHRLTFNGIWQLPYGFQASGLYFFADNGSVTPLSGVDVLGVGGMGCPADADFADSRPAARERHDHRAQQLRSV